MPEIDRIRYRFTDASVPPPDHRSFTLELASTTARWTVDCYGEILLERQAPGDHELLQAILHRFRTEQIRRRGAVDEEGPGCTGGTSESLTLFAGEDIFFAASITYGGEDKEGDLLGDLTPLVTLLAHPFFPMNTEAGETINELRLRLQGVHP